MKNQVDALIIGAGPAGSAAAILLADAGLRVALVEKQTYPRRKVCGECIAATNLPILHALGIGRAFSQLAGAPLRQVALVCGERIVRAPLPPFADPAHQWGAALGRENLDTMLLEQAKRRGVSVFQPWQMCSLSGAAGSFRCQLRSMDKRDEKTLDVSLVIDAHGSWEPPLPQAGHPDTPRRAQHRASDLFAFKANFSDAQLEPGLLPVLSFPGGYGGMVVAGDAVATFAACLRRDCLTQARLEFPGMKAADAAMAWVKQHSGATARLLGDAPQCGSWLGVGPVRPGIHIGRHDRVFKLGNAAGEAHPIIGEGISMALQSAVLLANTLSGRPAGLADGPLQVRLLGEYAKAWQQQFARRIRVSALYANLAMRPQLFSGLLPTLERHPALLTQFARWCGKVSAGPDLHGMAPSMSTTANFHMVETTSSKEYP